MSRYWIPFLVFRPLTSVAVEERGSWLLTSSPKISQRFNSNFCSGGLGFGGLVDELPGPLLASLLETADG